MTPVIPLQRAGGAMGLAALLGGLAWCAPAGAQYLDPFRRAETEAACYAAMTPCRDGAERAVPREPAASWNRRLVQYVNQCEQTANACADEVRDKAPRLPVRNAGLLLCADFSVVLFTDAQDGSWCKVGGRHKGCDFAGDFVEFKSSGMDFNDQWTLDIDRLQFDRLMILSVDHGRFESRRSKGVCRWGAGGDRRSDPSK